MSRLRTTRPRLGVMGVVPLYHAPWQLVEEIGMLDHLTGGRLEIGTAAGIPQEMAKMGMGVDEARARYDEAIEVLDKALAEPVTAPWPVLELRKFAPHSTSCATAAAAEMSLW